MSDHHVDYNIEYYSKNTYKESATEGIFEFNVSPCNAEGQILIDYSIKQTLCDSVFRQSNLFGFEINRIRSTAKFDEFYFRYQARVQKAKLPLAGVPALSLQEELDELSSDQFFVNHHLFLCPSFYTRLPEEQLSLVPLYEKNISSLDYLKKLNDHVHTSMKYESNITSVTTKASDALALSKGVCQDFAHVFIAMARNNGIPARYVSGYLHQGINYVGSSFMHAWVEAYVPGMGWIGFDPTNNILVDEHFIKVSHGADYADCSPIKGVLRTNGDSVMAYDVKVMSQQSQQ
jgi:transglutaminase-like putative cysteine protease